LAFGYGVLDIVSPNLAYYKSEVGLHAHVLRFRLFVYELDSSTTQLRFPSTNNQQHPTIQVQSSKRVASTVPLNPHFILPAPSFDHTDCSREVSINCHTHPTRSNRLFSCFSPVARQHRYRGGVTGSGTLVPTSFSCSGGGKRDFLSLLFTSRACNSFYAASHSSALIYR
jgi:hypothetical protein